MAQIKVLDGDRVKELWNAIKALLTLKVDKTELSSYTTNSDVDAKIIEKLSDYITLSQATQIIEDAIGELAGLSYQTVDSLPLEGETNVIYLAPSSNPGEQNTKDEYMWINDSWEKIGSTSADLSDYWSREDLKPITSEELQEILQ